MHIYDYILIIRNIAYIKRKYSKSEITAININKMEKLGTLRVNKVLLYILKKYYSAIKELEIIILKPIICRELKVSKIIQEENYKYWMFSLICAE